MELLEALDSFPDSGLIFTMPNADTSSPLMASLIEKYVKSRDNAASYSSLGVVRYLSALACVDGVIGNSSSGLLEAPILKKGTINIGDRQRGRLTYPSVINCEGISLEISKSINTLYSDQFQESLICGIGSISLPGSSDRIVEFIKGTSIEKLVAKTFYDMHCESFNSLEIGQANEN
jgi:GDP/UDP-N,N'-diacetylbacillosamine 2-epimerase (hydrolysing)